MYVYICLYVCLYVCVCMYLCMCVFVCMCVCVSEEGKKARGDELQLNGRMGGIWKDYRRQNY